MPPLGAVELRIVVPEEATRAEPEEMAQTVAARWVGMVTSARASADNTATVDLRTRPDASGEPPEQRHERVRDMVRRRRGRL